MLRDRRDFTAKELIFAGVAVACLTLLLMAPILPRMGTAVPGDRADPTFNAWAIAWGADRLPHALQGFWSPPIFYPSTNAMAYSENLLGVAVLVAPVYWISKNPLLAYNVAFLLSFVIAGIGAYMLARELTGSRTASALAAIAFAFVPYRWAQITHIQVLSVGWLPMALWSLHRFFRRPEWWTVPALIGSLMLLALSNGYAAYQAGLALVIVAAWCAVQHGVSRKVLIAGTSAALVTALLLLPAIRAYERVWSGRAPYGNDLVRYSANAAAYLDVLPSQPDARWLFGVAQDEGRLFPGVVVVLLSIVALLPIRWHSPSRRWRWLYLLVALVAGVISLGPQPKAWDHHLPLSAIYSWLLSTVPLFQALRVPARFGMLVLLAACMLAAIGAKRLLMGAGARIRIAATVLLSAVIVFEGYGGPLRITEAAPYRVPGDAPMVNWLSRQPRRVLLDLPISTQGIRSFGVSHMLLSLQHGHTIVGGASRVYPPLHELLGGSASPLVNPDLFDEAVPFLQTLGVGYVVMRPGLFRDRELSRQLLDVFERSEHSRQVARFDGIVAFEIDKGDPPPPEEPMDRVPAEALRLSASHNSERMRDAIDGDPDTRWISGVPQGNAEWVAIDFDSPRDVARVGFTISERSLRDYPREIEIVATGFAVAAEERVLYRGRILQGFARGFLHDPARPVATIELPSYVSTRLVIRQVGHANPWFWSIDELSLWERPRRR